ncbi:MAG: hypothetical protein ACT4N4_00540 [Rhodospirillales bacterium]
MRRFGGTIAAYLVVAAMWASAATAQTRVHGADSLFISPTIKLAWAVLKGRSESETRVVIRVANVAGEYRFIRVDGIDPFTKAHAVFMEPAALEKTADVSIARAKFADHPSTELRLFRDAAAMRGQNAALVIYYLGVTDTTPEFTTADAMSAYLNKILGIGR